jgi:hypothetical protein
MSPALIAIRAATTAVLAVALTGCSFGNGPEFLRRYERPAPGKQVPESFWTAASDEEASTVRVGTNDSARREDWDAFETSFWLLPTWFSGRRTSTPPQADSVVDTEFQFLDLGVVCIPFFPLWLSTDTQRVERSGERAESGMTWTPLWTVNGATNWPADEPRASARGVPLLYGWVEYGREGEEPVFEMHNVLWTLGPAWLRVDWPETGEPRIGLAADGELHPRGWAFSPLLLGGPGAWLWTSSEIEDDKLDHSMHGPLNGWLGYRSTLEHEPAGVFWIPPSASSPARPSRFSRRIVAGALWYDSEEIVGGVVSKARHGPLWGVFGWGQSSARPVIYLLWFPVEV